MAIKEHEFARGVIAYDRRGWGDPLVLIHGIYPGASHHEFVHNVDALAKHFTVYAIDLLGFGESSMPRMTHTVQSYQHLLRDFLIEVVGGPAHLLASGVSCGPAVALAVYNDSLVQKLVLIDPIVDPAQTEPPARFASKVQQFLLGTLSLGVGLYDAISSEFELRQFVRSRYAQPNRVTGEQILALHDRACQKHALHGFISQMTGNLVADVPSWLRYVRCPVLVVWGEQSGPPPRERLLVPAAWSKGKQIEVVPDAAHWPHDEQSAKVNQILIDFLDVPSPVPVQNGTA